MRTTLVISGLAALGMVVLGTGGCTSKKADGVPAKAPAANAAPAGAAVRVLVKAQPVQKADLAISIPLVGAVKAQTVVPVGALYGGRVAEVLVKEGDLVKKDQVLVTLDKRDVELRLQQADTAIEQAKKQLEAMGAAAALEKETLALGVKQAQASVAQVKANLEKVERGARPEEHRQVAAAVEVARAQVDSMQRELGRLDGLYENKIIPKSQLDKASDGYKVANAQYNSAMAQLALVNKGARDEDRDAVKAAFAQVEAVLELAQVATKRGEVRDQEVAAASIGLHQAELSREVAQRALDEMEVRAPVAGVIQQKKIEVGGMVGAGTPMFLLVPAGAVAVEALVTDNQKALIGPMAKADFTIEAIGKSGTGELLFLADTVDALRGGYLLRIGVPQNLLGLARDGMFVRMTLATGQVHQGALLVPAGAVLHREGKKVVFVVAQDKAELRPVETGLRQDGLVEVISGLKGGESVVTDGHLNLLNGATVQVKN
jgi:RND family efflux transporter MFP subunit